MIISGVSVDANSMIVFPIIGPLLPYTLLELGYCDYPALPCLVLLCRCEENEE